MSLFNFRPIPECVPCLTPGCGATPLNIEPSVARAMMEYNLRDDPTFKLKLHCERCQKTSDYSSDEVIRLIPVERRPQPLSANHFWGLFLLEIATADSMAERAFFGERLQLELLRHRDDLLEARLHGRSQFAPTLDPGSILVCGSWGSFQVCLYLVDGDHMVEIPRISQMPRNAIFGMFFSSKHGSNSHLKAANLFCSNPSCGYIFTHCCPINL